MKKLRIWLNSFTLVQQFLTIGLLTVMVLLFFFLFYFNRNVDHFVDSQMYAYIHRSQQSFIVSRENYQSYDDPNVSHFVYSNNSKSYLNDITVHQELLSLIKVDDHINTYDGYITKDDDIIKIDFDGITKGLKEFEIEEKVFNHFK